MAVCENCDNEAQIYIPTCCCDGVDLCRECAEVMTVIQFKEKFFYHAQG